MTSLDDNNLDQDTHLPFRARFEPASSAGSSPSVPSPVPAGGMRFAYADPPYLGCGAKFYSQHHEDAADWDDPREHERLIERLACGYPDGWALSCHVPSLRVLLPWCPRDVRVGAWVKPFHALKRGVRPSYGWEPVIFRGGRNKNHPPPLKGGKATTPRDFVSANITLRKGLTGAKPEAFNLWVLDLLNFRPGDELDDLFPGTDSMGAAVQTFLAQPVLIGDAS